MQGKRKTRAVALKSAPKRKKPSKSVTKSKNKKAAVKPSVEELLQKVFILVDSISSVVMYHQVNECVEHFEYDLALHYCETALPFAPSNVEVLETTGGLLLEMGDISRAIEIS